MKKTSISSLKYIIMFVAFIVTGIITFISMNYELSSAYTTTMSEATLPIVMIKTDSGMRFNMMHGYTCDVDEKNIKRDVTPLATDKKLPIVINTYGNEITGLSYKVRNISDMSLIENTEVTDYEVNGTSVDAVLNIKNLIEDNRQYYLEIVVSTKDHKEIKYYTSIISGAGFDVEAKMNFVIQFNSYIFDKSSLNKMQKYLETKASADSSNYAKANINSKQSHIGWGDINIFVEGDIVPSIQEINNEVAIINLHYIMGADNVNDSYDTYSVSEYYRIRQSGDTMYLLDFNRQAKQYFDGRNDITTSGINLGITSDNTASVMTDGAGKYIYFVNQGSLWCYAVEENMMTKVFSFDAQDSDNIREYYAEHSVKIVNVYDDGRCDFTVTGYMNRGEHEGSCGIDLFTYNYADNTTAERIYIPMELTYDELIENTGGISYVSDAGLFYILIDDTLYAVNLTSKEIMKEVSDLSEGTYCVSDSGRAIAYSLDDSRYDTKTIRILNMEKGSDYEIKCGDDERIKELGYINGDFIYGTANVSDISSDENGNVIFPMYKINIIDSDYNMIKEYGIGGTYITDAKVENLRVNLTCVTKDADGNYQTAPRDQLINREENTLSNYAKIETFSSVSRLQELYIVPEKSIANKDSVVLRYSSDITFIKEPGLEIK